MFAVENGGLRRGRPCSGSHGSTSTRGEEVPGSSQTESDAGKISGPMGKMDTGKMGRTMDTMDRPMDTMDTDKMGGSMDTIGHR